MGGCLYLFIVIYQNDRYVNFLLIEQNVNKTICLQVYIDDQLIKEI